MNHPITMYGWHSALPIEDRKAPANQFIDPNTARDAGALQTYSGSNGVCHTTGSMARLSVAGCAVIIGHPRWTDASLQTLAEQEGHAAALSQSYANRGAELLSELRGEFALAVIDESASTVLLATDRLGQHSVYYRSTEESTSFGLSLATLADEAATDSGLDKTGLYNYVYFHMVPSPLSIYPEISKLPPGCRLLVQDGKCDQRPYWLPSFRRPARYDFATSAKGLRRILKESVKRAINGESAVGAFLSGGLDSSTVSGMLAEVTDGTAQAFSIGFSAEGYDEMPYARITARHFGIELHEYYVTPEDIVDALPTIAASYDEPFGNSSALPAYFCAKIAAENGVRRLLAGDGGDELFAGNSRYVKQNVFDVYASVPRPLRTGLLEPLLQTLPAGIPLVGKARSYVSQANTPLPDRLQSYNFLHRLDPRDIFDAGILAELDTDLPLSMQRQRYSEPEGASKLDRMLYLDWKFTLADNDLRKVSHMCSLAGIDVTYPMLDDELVEFSCTIPDKWKIKRGNLRYFYREALRDWLPDETLKKKKHGFGLPFGVWMQSHAPLKSLAYESLLSLKKRHYFKPQFIDKAIDLHDGGHAAYYGELIWILMVLELWMQDHCRNE